MINETKFPEFFFRNISRNTGNYLETVCLHIIFRRCDIILLQFCCCCDVMFYCRRVTFQWRCWRQCWYGRSWCCTRGTLKLMTTDLHASSLASPGLLSAERTPRWRQYVGTGARLWEAGHSHKPGCGFAISWRKPLSVSVLHIVLSN